MHSELEWVYKNFFITLVCRSKTVQRDVAYYCGLLLEIIQYGMVHFELQRQPQTTKKLQNAFWMSQSEKHKVTLKLKPTFEI